MSPRDPTAATTHPACLPSYSPHLRVDHGVRAGVPRVQRALDEADLRAAPREGDAIASNPTKAAVVAPGASGDSQHDTAVAASWRSRHTQGTTHRGRKEGRPAQRAEGARLGRITGTRGRGQLQQRKPHSTPRHHPASTTQNIHPPPTQRSWQHHPVSWDAPAGRHNPLVARAHTWGRAHPGSPRAPRRQSASTCAQTAASSGCTAPWRDRPAGSVARGWRNAAGW